MKNRKSLCIIALMLAILLVMGGCKQAEAKEANTQPVEQVEETEETTEEPTIGESTEEELKAEAEAKAKAEAEAEKKAAEEAAAKAEAEKKAAEELKAKEAAEAAAKAEAEKKAAEEAAAKAEAERKAAEEAAKKEQEAQQSQASKPDSSQSQASTPESKPAESKPDTNTSTNSSGYTLNEYGNPVDEMAVRTGLVDTIVMSDPRFSKIGGVTAYHGSTPIPNPFAKVDPISPFRGMANPPADWPNPTANMNEKFGEYKWDSETGCWRYYNGRGEATKYYLSLYGKKTVRTSEVKSMDGSSYNNHGASTRGVY
ncbi:hypothetical protein [Negativibacillus massiliensis]|uniref:hypothetical protein n=1 Tax=Negativibacillus massiliensis TaxID=1871035 RepID=UPI003AF267F3